MTNLLVYLVVMSVTPGPNTILSMANAAAVGFRRGIRLNLGMLAGITIVSLLSLLSLEILYAVIPQAETAMKLLAFAYLVYLAVRMLMTPVSEAEAAGQGFVKGLLLQLVNVKVYFLALTGLSSYIMPMEVSPAGRLALTMLIPLICFISGLAWAIAGSLLSSAFTRHRRFFSLIFCLLLLWCAFRTVL